ncbi:putative MFS family arabinose efflux permease [Tumebacillus permanentifrigoris]|uniref:Putative MFS family arabinose efflux permease n=2 Tax=Tumebacillus permanentifrigoris TaxID=378543 RepID=A0A316DDM4_9BACL|nr:MFS transporter [Tumebacillus permanentifrigoris]PWK15796.1 putative MFS family arabinose efflux permease [Tumebacillus permanentifrigoris]
MEKTGTAPRSLWKNKIFTRMFVSYSISSFGDWFDMTALMILFSYTWHANSFLVALVPISYAVPSIALGQLAGVYADRWKKIQLMINTDLIRAVLTVALIFTGNPYWALPIMFLRATASVFNTPAQQALLRTSVPEEQLMKASAMIGMVMQISKVAGPLLGSILIALVSIKLCLVINAISFFISAVLLMTVGKVSEEGLSTPTPTETKPSLLQSWQEGWKTLFTIRMLYMSFAFYLVGFFTLQMVDSQFGILLREVVPGSETLLGYVISTVGFGMFTVGGILTGIKNIKSYGWTLSLGCLLTGLSFGGFGMFELGGPILWIYLCAFLGGLGVGLTIIGFSFLRQKETPPEMMGRITGITNSLTSAVVIIGPMVGGVMIGALGVSTAFQITGLVMLCVGVLGVLFKRLIWGSAQ